MGFQERIPAYASIFLVLFSALFIIGVLYVSDIFSISYGVGAGAFIQSNLSMVKPVQVLAPTIAETSSLHRAIQEAYVLLLISLIAFMIAVVIYATKAYRFGQAMRRYAISHFVVTFIFTILFLVVFSYFSISVNYVFENGLYASMLLAMALDVYFVIFSRKSVRKAPISKSIEIEPSKPFANLLKLRDTVFSGLSDHVMIVDKHVNSASLQNLYRLLSENTSVKKIDILTYPEAFDSSFNRNFVDFKKELGNKGIEVNLLIMSDSDAASQHERFVFDSVNAFKIPPLNIINEKSEHVTRIKLSDAKARFGELSKGAMKYENFLLKKARSSGESESKQSNDA
ncbi:MAG: hypothetical protein ACP5MC_01450 [Candidatus Micrarchaeia archaeon]